MPLPQRPCIAYRLVMATFSPIAESLLFWFDRSKRAMPWRETRDPYAIWLSETMLQQTQVDTVIPYYLKFLKRFPTVADLAAAPLDEVLQMWAGLGYYRRAKHLHAAAKAIVANHHSTLPQTAAALLTLPGIGRYTAGAVASIAFGQATPVLDGNVARVLARLTLLKEAINKPATVKKLWSLAELAMEEKAAARRPGDFNQALMELGATVCTPRNPQCLLCPLSDACKARKQGMQESIPFKDAKAKTKIMHRMAAVLSTGTPARYLLLQRPTGGLWESLWEFPTFDMPGALAGTPENAATPNPVVRKAETITSRVPLNWVAQITDVLKVRLGLHPDLDAWRGDVTHVLTHRTLHVAIVRGTVTGATAPSLPNCDASTYQAAKWVTAKQMQSMAVARITWRIAEAADLIT